MAHPWQMVEAKPWRRCAYGIVHDAALPARLMTRAMIVGVYVGHVEPVLITFEFGEFLDPALARSSCGDMTGAPS